MHIRVVTETGWRKGEGGICISPSVPKHSHVASGHSQVVDFRGAERDRTVGLLDAISDAFLLNQRVGVYFIPVHGNSAVIPRGYAGNASAAVSTLTGIRRRV